MLLLRRFQYFGINVTDIPEHFKIMRLIVLEEVSLYGFLIEMSIDFLLMLMNQKKTKNRINNMLL
jgi:hypothetical protein